MEDVAGFIAWLRRPRPTRDGAVAVVPSVAHHCAESTVNRKLAALSASNQHAGRHGVELGELRTTWQPAGRRGTGWKLFLHHISKGKPQSGRPRSAPRGRPSRGEFQGADPGKVPPGCGGGGGWFRG